MDPNSLVVRSQVDGVRFGMYTDEEVRAMSVIEITSPVAFDALGTPLPHGLYDPLLGPVESKGNTLCPTCSNVYIHCPGHSGHIELCVPAYHPLTFNKLLSLLRIKCLSCHNFRLDKQQTLKFAAKIHLLDVGRYQDALELEDTVSTKIRDALTRNSSRNDDMDESPTTHNRNRKQHQKDPLQQENRVSAATNIMREYLLQLLQIPIQPSITLHAHERVVRKQIIKEFLSDCLKCKKCHNCGAFSPKIRHDAFNKIFQTPLSDKNKKLNIADNIDILPASSTVQASSQKGGGDEGETKSGWDSDDSEMEVDRKEEQKTNHSTSVYTSDDELEQDDDDEPATSVHDILAGRNQQINTTSSTSTRRKSKRLGSTNKQKKADEYMHSLEVEAQVRLTWIQEPLVCSKVFGSAHIRTAQSPSSSSAYISERSEDRGASSNSKPWGIFFLRVISVPPSRFRPPMALGVMVVEHSQNVYLNKILTLNDKLRTYLAMIQGLTGNISATSLSNNSLASAMTLTDKENTQSKAISTWIELQTTVNCFMDSSRDPSATANAEPPNGVRQLLEKKEGIFRKHMMGKRVNFACRSVISPDPYIGTNEIGIPLYFAKVLTYPTPVTSLNVTEMRSLVIRGPRNYPGASWVELPNGQRLELDKMQQQKREALAARLLSSNGIVKVGRQLRNGDMVLMNRQPSLHKPSIMSHRVRILHSPTQKTIRMHYANCDTYNADYDGDEMNCHFPQNDICRAESEFIVRTDLQFIVPTDGSPLRGLIQDHVDAGVKLTSKDTFLEGWEYQQLIFSCLSSLSGLELLRPNEDIILLPPAIRKPRALWTGKQVITCLLQHLRNDGENESSMRNERLPGICIDRKARTPDYAFGGSMEEHLILIRDGELLRGVLDKNAFGATDLSLVHGVYEAYGPTRAGLLLNALGRLFTFYLQFFSGHSCRMEDLILSREAEHERRTLVERAYNIGSRAAKVWADSDGGKVDTSKLQVINESLRPFESATVSAKLGELLSGEEGNENAKIFDGYMQSQLNPMASQIIKACLPNGLAIQFPANTFSLMVLTGAKGSTVNQSQVSCLLGQQALEGRRVPRMSSGRTLPSFAPYDPSPRADGFIVDRFLTGVAPQNYYFHCMAGREGLIDTAVKTSRSGYLQRCLVKHLEELKVAYDHTVRDGEGGIVQFLYGEDGLDVTKARYLECSSTTLQYMARNSKALERRFMGLPNSSLDLATVDSNKVDSLSTDSPCLTLNKGSFVRARKLRIGTDWMRGKLHRGWFDAIVTKVYADAKSCDIKYVKDSTVAYKVPLEVSFSYAGTRNTRALSNTCKIIDTHVVQDPIISDCSQERGGHRIGSSGSCVSEAVAAATYKHISNDNSVQSALKATKLTRDDISRIVANKYASSLCAPGEAVGCIAAQSIGEPSTQMTLNTFHLAGAGANVTLGIPRLREIIMTASKDLKTPSMSVPLHPSVSDREATKLARYFTRLSLLELIANQRGITVVESLQQSSGGTWQRAYHVTLKLHSSERIKEAFGLTLEDIATKVSNVFIKNLSRIMKMELKKSSIDESKSFDVISDGDHSQEIYEKKQKLSKKSKDYDEDDEDAAGEEDGVVASRFGHKKEMTSYGDMDDEEKEIIGSMDKEETLQYEDENNEGPTPVTDDEGDMDDEDSNAFSGVAIDKLSNTLILQPFRVDPSARPLLMVGLVERAAAGTLIRSRNKIDRAFIENEEGRGRCLITMGCNFEEIWNLINVDHGKLSSNDIWAIRSHYGVEAARMSIVNQIRGVFAVYGISIDNRHLSLIADYMTFDGNFKPMNRIGMADSSSAFLQMSFETTANFMVDAALTERHEPVMSPSANIVMGRPIKHGTGAFECLAQAQTVS